MATTLASGHKSAVIYTDNGGTNYVTSMKTAELSANGTTLGATEPEAGIVYASVPNGFKTRKARVVTAAKNVRWVTCYTKTAPAFTLAGETVNLTLNGVDAAFFSDGTVRAEKPERKPIAPGASSA